jgi:hypothetical protein
MTDGTRALVVQMRESLSGAVEWTDTLLATLIAVESAFAQKCADTWCTSRNAETLETARAAIAAAGGKVSRNTEPER